MTTSTGQRPQRSRTSNGSHRSSDRSGARTRIASKVAARRRKSTISPAGQRLSYLLTLLFLALTLFGLVMVLSASLVTSLHQYDQSPYHQFQRQLMWAVLGAIAFVVASRMDYRWLQRAATPMLLGALGLLVAVLIPGVGKNINGSSRWLGVGPVVIQPSEVAKIAFVIFVADLLTRRHKRMDRSDLTVRPVIFVLALVSGLMLAQPKLGTPILLAVVALMMLFIAGARINALLGYGFVGVLAATFFAYSEPYRRRRLLAFLDPWEDPFGNGLQTIQSHVGIASGGIFGVGLGAGRAKWGFLPYAHSDFIFAIIAEEIGLVGSASVVLAFVLLAYLGMRTAMKAPDRFGMLLAVGITSWLIVQAFLNIGMAIGLMPITGEPLPFLSAGGSSLCATLGAAGILTSVARRARA